MIKAPPPENRVTISILECRGQGVSVATVLDGFKRMKADLEALGCEVTMNIDGLPIDAFSVEEILEGVSDATT